MEKIQCLKCLSSAPFDVNFVRALLGSPDARAPDLLAIDEGFSCSNCSSKKPYRIIQHDGVVIVDSRLRVCCPNCKNHIAITDLERMYNTKIVGCDRCKYSSKSSNEKPKKNQEIDGIYFFGWHLPLNDTYFSNEIISNFAKFREAGYQTQHRIHALEFVQDFSVAIDVGGHFGFWARGLSAKFQKTLVFEPNPYAHQFLAANVPNAEIYKFGLGSQPKKMPLSLANNDNSGAAFLDVCHTEKTIDVEIKTLDSLDLPNISFMKFDIEGFELEAIKGAKKTISNCRPVINIEVKSSNAERWGLKQHDAVNFLLQNLKYKLLGRYVDEWVLGPPG